MFLSEPTTVLLLRISEVLLLASGAVLVIGLIGEYRLPFWHPRLELFELLVLIGCAGELLADGGIFVFSEHLQKIEHIRISDLAAQTNDAVGKASKAVADFKQIDGRVNLLNSEADALTLRMTGIKKAVDFETPRRALLLASAPKIIKLLAPFRGQKVGLYVCEASRHDHETMDTWGTLANILAADTAMGLNKPHFIGAGWKEVPSNLTVMQGDCSPGVQVSVSKSGTLEARKAAKALGSAILSALPVSIFNSSQEINPETINFMLSHGISKRGDAGVDAIVDPSLVVVVIGTHPVQ